MKQKDTSVPEGTIETFGFWFRARLSDCQHSSIVPFLLRRPDYGGQAGTDSSLKTLTQHFVLGYFRQVPAGLIFSNRHRTKTSASSAGKATARRSHRRESPKPRL